MTFAITTGKGSKVPGRTWARTFVFVGFIPVHKDRDMMRLPRNKLILFKSMETRVRGSHQRAWCNVPEQVSEVSSPTAFSITR